MPDPNTSGSNPAGRRKSPLPIIVIVIIVIILLIIATLIILIATGVIKINDGSSKCVGPPSNVVVSTTGGKATVTWSAVNGAKSYNIYINKADGSFVAKIVACHSGAGLNIKCGQYFVQVSSNGDGCEGSKGNKVSFDIPCCPQPLIDPPVNFRYEGTESPGEVTLLWDPVVGATSYNIYRKQGTSVTTTSYDELENTTATTFTFVNVMPGTNQAFIVQTVNACGDGGSASSVLLVDVCCAMPPPVTIIDITSTKNSVTITWQLNPLTENYVVYIKRGNTVSYNNYDDMEELDNKHNTFTFTGLDCDTKYAIGVAGLNGCAYGVLNYGTEFTQEWSEGPTSKHQITSTMKEKVQLAKPYPVKHKIPDSRTVTTGNDQSKKADAPVAAETKPILVSPQRPKAETKKVGFNPILNRKQTLPLSV